MERGRERGRSRNSRADQQNSTGPQFRTRSISRDKTTTDYRSSRSTSQVRVPTVFHKKGTGTLTVPPAPKDVCPTLRKGFLCDSNFCKKDHQLESLTDRELLLLIARKTCGSTDSSLNIAAPKDLRLANPTADDFKQDGSPKLTLKLLVETAEFWANQNINEVDDAKLRALLTLSAVLVRKFSKSQLSQLCESHLRRENLGQDQAESVLEVYQRLHSDKGGAFEAALWQQWDRQSLTMFISAFLHVALQLSCESSTVVISGLRLLAPPSVNEGLPPAPGEYTWSEDSTT
ncbi:minor nucleoprotein [Sudan ebolavirus]|uniref:Transcriptional activator VP30 n=2 Tax=Sudan ebolavirus TaxID=186540 RepID=VP30_EBOSU|nr:minor nucleoprotein [Sudan ebolavirus]Q5XX03.1 RecName: Full=Transcriptional activator VP30; AltName: Full=EbolaVP30; Short=eVP30; AltName: Full=Minor nucleoprotein VP30 [Sudan ebolavirus - Uganda (2000)]AAU43888.1 minor nucleoprotein [Sudan ebolavirus]AKB09539.1 minor nucleoprotein VP30 [Sudan ebolavirus]ALT19782.1 minor nucleoprotein VP30 [Sudan ebolavirus]APT69555.1 minor nucleoprotein [Sudan ebolavirus]APT69615.1 minor nucleoprotein [Sudan ebolavirus]